MKKVVILFLVFLMISSPAYAVNPIDTLLYKKVVLTTNGRTVLVNRLTGKVKYILRKHNRWALLKGQDKDAYQTVYDLQAARSKQ